MNLFFLAIFFLLAEYEIMFMIDFNHKLNNKFSKFSNAAVSLLFFYNRDIKVEYWKFMLRKPY